MKVENARGASLLGAAWFVACSGQVSLGSPDTPNADGGRIPTVTPDAGRGAGSVPPTNVHPGAVDASPSSGADATIDAGTDGGCGGMQFDPHNCGVCGNDCMGGACQAGACVPLPAGALATGQLSPTSIVVDANNVYWVNEGLPSTSASGPTGWLGPVQILKCAKTGCSNNPTVLVSHSYDLGDGGRLRGLAVDGTNIYWTTRNALMACAVGGCNNTPTRLHYYDGTDVGGWPGVAPEIAVALGNVYASDPDSTYAYSLDAGFSSLWSLGSFGIWMSVGVDDARAYIGTTSGEMVSCALGGCSGAPTLLVSAPMQSSPSNFLGQLAVDDTNIYWGQGSGGTEIYMPVKNGFITGCAGTGQVPTGEILKCAKGGCGGNPTALVSNLSCPTGVVTDGVSVYFTEQEYFGGGPTPGLNDADVGRIAKCAVAGCSSQPTALAEKVNNPRGIAVDGSYVYWTDFGSGGTVPSVNGPPQEPPYSDDGRIVMIAK